MNIRLTYSVIFAALSAALVVCGIIAFRSRREISLALGIMIFSLIPPMAGNLLIIGSTTRTPPSSAATCTISELTSRPSACSALPSPTATHPGRATRCGCSC